MDGILARISNTDITLFLALAFGIAMYAAIFWTYRGEVAEKLRSLLGLSASASGETGSTPRVPAKNAVTNTLDSDTNSNPTSSGPSSVPIAFTVAVGALGCAVGAAYGQTTAVVLSAVLLAMTLALTVFRRRSDADK